MTALCQPLPRPVIEDFLRDAARSLCDRPGDTADQRDKRTHRMVHTIMGFQPRDGLEYMLSTLAIGHCDLILDSMRDVFQGQIDTMKGRTKGGIVGLGRAMRGLLADLRRAAARPLTEEAQRGEDARQAEAAPHPVPAAPARRPAPHGAAVSAIPSPAAPVRAEAASVPTEAVKPPAATANDTAAEADGPVAPEPVAPKLVTPEMEFRPSNAQGSPAAPVRPAAPAVVPWTHRERPSADGRGVPAPGARGMGTMGSDRSGARPG